MTRQYWIRMIPKEWDEREANGQCSVCGIHKSLFEKGMKKFCSEKCKKEYSNKLVFWESLRLKALQRDNYTCQECGINDEKLQKEWEENKQRWHEKNLDFVLKTQHDEMDKKREEIEKTVQDRLETISELLEVLSDEHKIAERVLRNFRWNDVKLPYKNYPDKPSISLEVDHVHAIVNGGDEWNLENLRTLCHDCHLKKTKHDMNEHRNGKKGIVTIEEVLK